jgi:hypothetical protein
MCPAPRTPGMGIEASLTQTCAMDSNSSFTPLDRRAANSDSLYMAISAAEPAARRSQAPHVPVRRYLSEAPRRQADRKRWAEVLERNVGEFCIYAGAVESNEGGYTSAVEVHRVHGKSGASEIIYSSDRIAGDHRFEAAASALRHALDIGHQAIRLRKSLAQTKPA